MSFITLPSSQVLELCQQKEDILQARLEGAIRGQAETRQEEMIRERDIKRQSLWYKIFPFKDEPIPSVQDLMERVNKNLIRIRYWNHFKVIAELTTAASVAQEVHVSTFDLQLLSDI